MIKGTIYKWQQPVAYYFCEAKAHEVKSIFKFVVNAVLKISLIPVAIIFDEGTTFS